MGGFGCGQAWCYTPRWSGSGDSWPAPRVLQLKGDGLSHTLRAVGLEGDALEQSADDQISALTHLCVSAGVGVSRAWQGQEL